MKVAVIGAGAVGGYFGGRLALGGNDVVFLARGKTLEALGRGPLRVESIKGDFEVPVRATDNGEEIGPVDLVLVAVKAWQVNEAAAAIRPMLGRDSIVVPIQNGVDAPAQLAAALGSDHVAGGLCKIIASAVVPGHIRHIAAEPFVAFGEIYRDRSGHRLEKSRDAFAAAGVRCEIARDIVTAIWEKFLFSVPWGSLGAITKLPVGEIRTGAKLRAQLIEAMQEVVNIAGAKGINFPNDVVSNTMTVTDGLPADSTSSMQRDIDLQPILEGELLRVRPLRPEDWDDLYAVASDPLIWEQHPNNDRYKEEVFKEFFREALESGGALIVIDSKNGQVIGSSRFYGYDKEKSEIEIGWTFLARSHWGGIHNKEMKQLMLRHAFRFVKSVVFLVGPQNLRSQRAMEKIGGVRVESRPDDNGRERFVFQITAPPSP